MSLTLSKEGKIAISKLINEMAFACSIYQVYFNNFAEKQEFGTREDLNGKEAFVLANALQTVQRDRDDDYDYNVFL